MVVVEPVVQLAAGQRQQELRDVHRRIRVAYPFRHYLLQLPHQRLELLLRCCLGVLSRLVVLPQDHLIFALLQRGPVGLAVEDALLVLRGRPDEQVLHLPVDPIHVDDLVQLRQLLLGEVLEAEELLIDHSECADAARPDDQHLFVEGNDPFEFVLFPPGVEQIRPHLLVLALLVQLEHQLHGVAVGHEEAVAVGEALEGLVLVVLAPDHGLLRQHGRERKGGVEVDVAAVADFAVGMVFGVASEAALGDCDVDAAALRADAYVGQDDAFRPVDAVAVDEAVQLGVGEVLAVRGQVLEADEVDLYAAVDADSHKEAVVILSADLVLSPPYHWLTAPRQSVADEPRPRGLLDLPGVQVEHAELALRQEHQREEVGDDDLEVRELDVLFEEDHVHRVLE